MPVTPAAPRKRTGSNKRRRLHRYTTRFDDAEDTKLKARARASNLSVSAYIRECALDEAGPRSRRTPPSKGPELGRAVAAINRVGGNLRQLIAIFEAAAAHVIAERCRAALGEAQSVVTVILDIASGRGARLENPAQLDSATAVLNEAGRPLDSVLHRLNAGASDVTTREAQAATAEVHAALITMRQILGPLENPARRA
jgi:methyl-accepting chemotaxis protein